MGNFSLRIVGLSSLLGLSILASPASLADYESGSPQRSDAPTLPGGIRAYVPPSDIQRPREDHTGGGVRGCGSELAALAPRLNGIGQTASSHPTLVWYNFSDAEEPIELHLYEYLPDGSLEEVFIRELGPGSQGYSAYTLPEADPGLTAGSTYLWQVVLYCDSDFEEVGQWTSADLQVVPPPANLSLPATTAEAARTAAASGLWYDALAAVYSGDTFEAASLRRDLLLDLADLEISEAESPVNLSDQLRRIAEN